MTREEFENGLMARLEDIVAFYKQYNPSAFENDNKPYLSMFINGDFICANNGYYNVNEDNPDVKWKVNCWKRGNGHICHNDF